MLKIILLLCAINVFAEKPDGKRIDAVNDQAQQMLQQNVIAPEEAYENTNEVLKEIKEEFKHRRKSKNFKLPEVEAILEEKPQSKSVAVPRFKSETRKTHVDFITYNFERVDKELVLLRERITTLNEMLMEANNREIKYIVAFERMQEQNIANLPKFQRYDHFFMKWDGTKETFGDLSLFAGGGGGAVLLAVLTWFSKGFLRRRKEKKIPDPVA